MEKGSPDESLGQQLTRIIGTALASYVGLFMMRSPTNMVKNLLKDCRPREAVWEKSVRPFLS